VNVRFNLLDHGDLPAIAVQSNVEWVDGPEKVFKNLDGISAEAVAFVSVCLVIY
jgi:hypothetical protein